MGSKSVIKDFNFIYASNQKEFLNLLYKDNIMLTEYISRLEISDYSISKIETLKSFVEISNYLIEFLSNKIVYNIKNLIYLIEKCYDLLKLKDNLEDDEFRKKILKRISSVWCFLKKNIKAKPLQDNKVKSKSLYKNNRTQNNKYDLYLKNIIMC